jgi:hypothetical protein
MGLAHESAVTDATDESVIDPSRRRIQPEPPRDREIQSPLQNDRRADDVAARGAADRGAHDGSDPDRPALEPLQAEPLLAAEPGHAPECGNTEEPTELSPRTWPRRWNHEVPTAERAADQLDHDETPGWEP